MPRLTIEGASVSEVFDALQKEFGSMVPTEATILEFKEALKEEREAHDETKRLLDKHLRAGAGEVPDLIGRLVETVRVLKRLRAELNAK